MKQFLLAALIPAALLLASCANEGTAPQAQESATTTTAVTSSAPSESTALTTTTTAPAPVSAASTSIYGVTAGGVTTAVSAPIAMSATEMHQNCTGLKAWADSIGISDAETLLSFVQTSKGDGTWSGATPSEQAATVAIVNAVADGDC